MDPPRPTVNAVLGYVLQEFRATGRWPLTTTVEIAFRTQGSAKRLIAELPTGIAVWEWAGPESQCYLTLRGLQPQAGTEDDVGNFLRVIRYVASRYVGGGGSAEVSETGFQTDLGLSPIEARRVAELIRREPDLFGSYTMPPDGRPWSFVPNRFAARLENVRSLPEYWRLHDQFVEDETAAAFAAQGRIRQLEQPPVRVPGKVSLLTSLTRLLEAEKAERGIFWAVLAVVVGLVLAAVGLF